MLRPLFLHKSGEFGVSVGALPSEDEHLPCNQKTKKKKNLFFACVMSSLWTLWRVRCLWAFPLGVDASLVYPLIGLLHVLLVTTRLLLVLIALLCFVMCFAAVS